MTTRSDFDDAAWDRVAKAPVLAAAVISAADDVGEDDESEQQELAAFKASLEKLAKKYRKSELVQAVYDALQGEEMADFWATHGQMGAAVSHESPLEDRIRELGVVSELVDGVADRKEARAYKDFVYEAAHAVARASKEGFFVLSAKISKKEDFYLRQLRSAMRI